MDAIYLGEWISSTLYAYTMEYVQLREYELDLHTAT